jgi:hypothetical protein
MYTTRELADPVVRQRVEDDRRESTPTPVWHLAKSANVDEKAMMHHLGTLGIETFRWGAEMLWHVGKADVRKLMGIEGQL